MKKRMQDENLMKISEKADRCISDPDAAKLLLCYLLYRMEEPMDAELLYDIAVTGGIITYFAYQEALDSLVKFGSMVKKKNQKGELLYELTDYGTECAKKLKTISAKSYRDQIVVEAQKARKRRRYQKNVHISYETEKQGCYLHVTLSDDGLKLLELKLFTPNEMLAEQLGEQILANPSALYHDVIEAVMKRHEEQIDLTDN